MSWEGIKGEVDSAHLGLKGGEIASAGCCAITLPLSSLCVCESKRRGEGPRQISMQITPHC